MDGLPPNADFPKQILPKHSKSIDRDKQFYLLELEMERLVGSRTFGRG